MTANAEQLLGWWQIHGRKDPAHKPWMFKSDGTWPLPEDSLTPYGIWVAEATALGVAGLLEELTD